MKTLTITNLEVLNIFAWSNQLTEEKNNAIPMKIRFYLKKALQKMLVDRDFFMSFRDTEVKKLQDKYFDEEHSYETYETTKNPDGSRQIDENGAEVTHAVRKVKDEYMPEYSKEVEVINNKLNELLMEKNTYTFEGADINGMVENLPDDGGALDFEDINMLDAILGENGEA